VANGENRDRIRAVTATADTTTVKESKNSDFSHSYHLRDTIPHHVPLHGPLAGVLHYPMVPVPPPRPNDAAVRRAGVPAGRELAIGVPVMWPSGDIVLCGLSPSLFTLRACAGGRRAQVQAQEQDAINRALVRTLLDITTAPGWEEVSQEDEVYIAKKALAPEFEVAGRCLGPEAKFAVVMAQAVLEAPPEQVYGYFMDNKVGGPLRGGPRVVL